jgi:hypothetical protein
LPPCKTLMKIFRHDTQMLRNQVLPDSTAQSSSTKDLTAFKLNNLRLVRADLSFETIAPAPRSTTPAFCLGTMCLPINQQSYGRILVMA